MTKEFKKRTPTMSMVSGIAERLTCWKTVRSDPAGRQVQLFAIFRADRLAVSGQDIDPAHVTPRIAEPHRNDIRALVGHLPEPANCLTFSNNAVGGRGDHRKEKNQHSWDHDPRHTRPPFSVSNDYGQLEAAYASPERDSCALDATLVRRQFAARS
jgi:hypothetical protein